MHDLDLLLTLTGGLGAALLFGYVSLKLGLSPIVGYLLAGIAVGPNTPGFVANVEIASQLAELGVVLLMFGVGLHFDFRELSHVGGTAIPGALVQSIGTALLGGLAAWWFGWPAKAVVVFGLSISFASTVVVTRVLTDANLLQTRVGGIAIGWLVVQDLLAVIELVLLPSFAGDTTIDVSALLMALLSASVKIAVVAIVIVFGGGRFIPFMLKKIAATHSRELFTLTILVVVLGVALASARLFGISMALGAFLAGVVVGQSDFSLRAAADALPMRDAFAVLFFVSVGMLFTPMVLVRSTGLVVSTLIIVVVGTPLLSALILLALGHSLQTASRVALSLGQIGEFSFILTTLAISLKLLTDEAMQVLVTVSIVSISLSPLLQRFADPAIQNFARYALPSQLRFVRKPFSSRVLAGPTEQMIVNDDEPRTVVVGYGPVGTTVARLLSENGVRPTIVELNHESMAAIRQAGYPAILGDANDPETLKRAGLSSSSSIILTALSSGGMQEVIRISRSLNPDIRVIIRVPYLNQRELLFQSGADQVFAGEGEVALAMAEYILRDLGATPEKIDRERERLRGTLFT